MKPYEFLLSLILILFVSGLNADEELVPKSDGEVEMGPPQEAPIVVLCDVDHILGLLDDNEKRLMLAVLYNPSCPHSVPMVALLEQTAVDLQAYFDTFLVSVERPILAKLDIRNDESFTASLGIDSIPSFYFFRVVKQELVVMDYMGHSEESHQVTSVVLHYWYRYAYGPVFELDTMEGVQAFLDHNGPGMLSPVKGGLHPDYTDDEKETIAWLMNTPDDPFSIFIQCQSSSKQPQPAAYQELEDFCQLQLARRDVACFSILNCGTGIDGEIVSILVRADDNFAGVASMKRPASQPIHQFGIQRATPTLLFFERVSTAPIAFPLWRSVHAVLFVKLARDEASRDAILKFYDACLQRRLATTAQDMVCLVVPETETRVLTTFGVDIWTPLDERVAKGTKVPDLLPAMMITDQRATNQLKRYYLDAPQLIHDGEDTIESFFRAFWNHELEPECKSSNKPLRKNKYGVEMISGKTFQAAVLDRVERHSLLYVFSPTCGHCKRFSILWNKLAALVVSVGWSDFLDIQQLDSTKNEIIQVEIDPAFVPAVYYFGPDQNKTTPIYYDVVDRFQHGAGRLDNPLEIVDWFLDVAGLDAGLLLDALDK